MIDRSDLDTLQFPLHTLDIDTPAEFSSRVRTDVAALTDTGRVRDKNEDHYLVARAGRRVETLMSNIPSSDVPAEFSESAYVMIVADGMGGAAGGEVASRMAIATLMNIVIHVPDWILRLDEEHAQKLMERAGKYYREVNRALIEKARVDPRLRGMGTTMTATYSLGDELFIAHVGDSRVYLFRDDKLQLLTRDQTQAQLLADAGVIRQQEVARHRLRHLLTNALGANGGDLECEIHRAKLCDGDRLLLCTDGLTDMLDDETIAGVLRNEDASDEACQRLVDRALEAGGRDNVTVVLARYLIPEVADSD